jgi:hypothetical protein
MTFAGIPGNSVESSASNSCQTTYQVCHNMLSPTAHQTVQSPWASFVSSLQKVGRRYIHQCHCSTPCSTCHWPVQINETTLPITTLPAFQEVRPESADATATCCSSSDMQFCATPAVKMGAATTASARAAGSGLHQHAKHQVLTVEFGCIAGVQLTSCASTKVGSLQLTSARLQPSLPCR